MDVQQIRTVDAWEVVQPKKSGKTVEPLTKAKKKILKENMPTIEQNGMFIFRYVKHRFTPYRMSRIIGLSEYAGEGGV